MSKRILFLILMLFACASVRAQSQYTAVITFTNIPVTGNAITNNGNYRYWTNVTAAGTILTNLAGLNQSSTNLWQQISANPYALQQVSKTNANTVRLISLQPINIGLLGTYATVTYYTNVGTNSVVIRVPLDVLPAATRTQHMTMLATGLVSSSFSLPTNAPLIANAVTLGPPSGGGVQTVTAPKVFMLLSGTIVNLT